MPTSKIFATVCLFVCHPSVIRLILADERLLPYLEKNTIRKRPVEELLHYAAARVIAQNFSIQSVPGPCLDQHFFLTFTLNFADIF